MKKNNILIVVTIILIFTLVFIGLIDSGVININNKKSNSLDNKYVDVDISDKKIIDLYDSLNTFTYSLKSNNCVDYDFDYYTDKEVKLKDLSYKHVTMMLLKYIFSNKSLEVNSTFTKDDMSEAVQKTLGKNYNYENKNIDFACPKVSYDSSSGLYTVTEDCQTSCGMRNLKRLEKAEKNNKSIILYVRLLFYKDGNYYKDYKRTESIKFDVDWQQYKYFNVEDGVKDEDFVKGALYQVKFNKEGKRYIFESSKVISE